MSGALIGLRTLRELRLTPGSLETLSAADLLDQSSSLQILDVSDNKLRQFPTDAIQTLSALRVLNVRANLFDHLAAGLFMFSLPSNNSCLQYLFRYIVQVRI